ncbi:hypothetical protein [Pseudarthrobacter sulfonivorans]|jgi:hypothetical protein|uniref:biotin synthase auxiliary protein BsaP n=1 Tax=Pseudarthrobacter sulfonivorans TaxID=121292 RepID=UPI00285F3783|nr:hypothetical protein [Pseudarthrobacter sulfonivorans]MDR6415757.1 hypothetical protein [Pseudarthrobacter sulfonivorans]
MNRVPLPTGPTTAEFCGHCGEPSDGGAPPPSHAHRQCQELLQLEPPRYCRECGRRLKVQVSPLGWWAACSRHGRSEAD